MSKRNISTVAILTNKFNSCVKKNPFDMTRETLIFCLRSCGFRGDFSQMMKPLLRNGAVIRVCQGDYLLQPVTLDVMEQILWDYRLNNRRKNSSYTQRKLNMKCEEYRTFLEKHGYTVLDKTLNVA